MNKKKIFNDPVYGFISIPNDLVFDLIEHPYFQRLRRIRQLGLTHMVYPGALHTRFHHALGAMHLMCHAIDVLRSKGQKITEEEAEAVTVAILLHDIGHGPFSHSLENTIVSGIHHEQVSEMFMERLNQHFQNRLTLAIRIFRNEYRKKFLHQLVSSQLDMDRLDYLKRDSFYTGVSEGVISSDRIITMLDVCNDELVIESKGIYSVEKFIIARRLMYWQVYLHKTVVSVETLLIQILDRAKELARMNIELFATPALQTFLYSDMTQASFNADETLLDIFAELDDNDIYTSIKVWQYHQDKVLGLLCRAMNERKLNRVIIRDKAFDPKVVEEIQNKVALRYNISYKEAEHFVITGSLANNAYNAANDRINILYRDQQVTDIAEAADQLNISALSSPVTKHYLYYPKDITVNL